MVVCIAGCGKPCPTCREWTDESPFLSFASMARVPNDAWMQIAPLDRLVDALPGSERTDLGNGQGKLRFSMYLKGTEAIFVVEGGDDIVEVKFRYRRQAGAWQMFRREGSRWVADGPASVRAGRLLEQIVLVMQGADPRMIFPGEV